MAAYGEIDDVIDDEPDRWIATLFDDCHGETENRRSANIDLVTNALPWAPSTPRRRGQGERGLYFAAPRR